MQEMWVQSLGWEDPLEKEMASHSSILAWRIPWTEELGGYSPRVAKSQTRLKQLSSSSSSKQSKPGLGKFWQCQSGTFVVSWLQFGNF